jgi:hypothetical protein
MGGSTAPGHTQNLQVSLISLIYFYSNIVIVKKKEDFYFITTVLKKGFKVLHWKFYDMIIQSPHDTNLKGI